MTPGPTFIRQICMYPTEHDGPQPASERPHPSSMPYPNVSAPAPRSTRPSGGSRASNVTPSVGRDGGVLVRAGPSQAARPRGLAPPGSAAARERGRAHVPRRHRRHHPRRPGKRCHRTHRSRLSTAPPSRRSAPPISTSGGPRSPRPTATCARPRAGPSRANNTSRAPPIAEQNRRQTAPVLLSPQRLERAPRNTPPGGAGDQPRGIFTRSPGASSIAQSGPGEANEGEEVKVQWQP
jgi:hypothetical protein